MNGFQPVNPFGAFEQGYGIGGAINQNIQAERARQAEAARLAEENRLFDLMMSPNASPADYMNYMRILPKDQRESMEAAYNNMTTQERQRDAEFSLSLRAAMDTDPVVFNNMVDQAILGFENEGNVQGAAEMKKLKEAYATDRNQAKTILDLGTMGNEIYRTALESQVGLEGATQQQQLDLVRAAVESGLSTEKAEELSTIAAYFGDDYAWEMLQYVPGVTGEALDPNKKLQMELDLYDRYQKRVGNYQDALISYDKMQASATAETGQGDLALIFQFMRMLDPGSVVRESEYAAAQDTGTLYQELKNMYDGWTAGDKLQPEQRARFTDLAKKYMDAATREEERARKDITPAVTKYGLDPNIVFGERADVPMGEQAPVTATTEIINPNPQANAFVNFIQNDPTGPQITDEDRQAFKTESLAELQARFPNTYRRYLDSLVPGATIQAPPVQTGPPAGFENVEDL